MDHLTQGSRSQIQELLVLLCECTQKKNILKTNLAADLSREQHKPAKVHKPTNSKETSI